MQETTVKRDTILLKKEDLNKEKQDIQKSLAQQMTKHIDETSQYREIEK